MADKLELKRPLINIRSRLEDIPRDWLINIEPFVFRAPRFAECWLWQGQQDKGYARMYRAVVGEDGKKKSGNRCARRFVAHLFWDFEDDAFYVRNSCKNNMCVNPNHIFATTEHWKQNDVGN